jgi:serine protease Do
MAIQKISRLVTIAVLGLGLSACALAGEGHASAYLGVMVDNVSPEKATALHLKPGTGAAIAGVDQDGPAFRAGLKNGDIVIAFDGKPVEGADQFAGLIHASAPGKTAAMTLVRDGQQQEVKVTLGDWSPMAHMPRPPMPPHGGMAMTGPVAALPPLPRTYPDIEVPSFTQLSSRHGVVVEPLSSQLCDFFGVPQNKGVLVRSVEKGSAGAAAGLKAGDVIVRINGETIHDMADWRRALKARNGKVKLAIVRDKKEQTIEINLPASSSELKGEGWDSFDGDMHAMAEEIQKLGPEIAKNAQELAMSVKPNQQELEQMRRQIQDSMKALTPELQQQMEKLRPEIEKSAKQLAESMKPTQKQMEQMRWEIEKSMKEMGPELQREMEQLKQNLEQQKHDWQEMMKGSDSNREF